ncbi:CRISPR-associated endonuclease Cas2 [Neobacillus sp. YIM B02564]|jgi:CRISPR-associated protein Cas2|uniref:CRISPR-associated endoribonuclease Cas2 n=1 Tax=Neobacillus paridis TaxID=2803862 RepID=A0ABS1TK48_9BACI|nr:CRISPR-associated endonuclease Cas2 [Neobacillus paridis]MBL4951662.1 CRISPR-associated endonuclease Cas2 [Neobacillus paridis]
MKILLIYDITEDKLRNKTANMCKDYGLFRVQYSAFFGEISRNLHGELTRRLKDLLKESGRSSVIIFPLSQDSLENVVKLDFNYSEEAI